MDPSKFNAYATSKSVSQEFLNTSSIQAKIALLVGIFSAKDNTIPLTDFEIGLIVVIAFSLCIQFIIFILLVLLAKTDTDKVYGTVDTKSVNDAVTILSGLALINDIIISIISIEVLSPG